MRWAFLVTVIGLAAFLENRPKGCADGSCRLEKPSAPVTLAEARGDLDALGLRWAGGR